MPNCRRIVLRGAFPAGFLGRTLMLMFVLRFSRGAGAQIHAFSAGEFIWTEEKPQSNLILKN